MFVLQCRAGVMELVAEWWNCSLAGDHYLCLRQKELCQLPTYHARSPQLNIRLHVVDWLAILCDTTGVCLTARHLAVALLDYFMDQFIVDKCHITLVALSCLHIAGMCHVACLVCIWVINRMLNEH